MQNLPLPLRFDPDRLRRLLDLVGPTEARTFLTQLDRDLSDCARSLAAATDRQDWPALREASHVLVSLAGSAGALALQAMGDKFQSILDVTIYYPDGVPTFWGFLCGKVHRVVVRVRPIAVPQVLLGGDYGQDPEFRAAFSAWVAELWRAKDAQLAALRQADSPS